MTSTNRISGNMDCNVNSYGISQHHQHNLYSETDRQRESLESKASFNYIPVEATPTESKVKKNLEHSLTVLQVLDDTKQIYREKKMYKEFIECIQKSLQLKLDLLISEGENNNTDVDLRLIEKILKEIIKEINEEAMEQLEASDVNSSLYLLSMGLEMIQSFSKFDFNVESSKSFCSLKILCLNNMAFVYRRLGNLNSSLNCLHKASDISESIGITENIAVTHLNICAVLSKLKQHNLAIEHAQQAVYLAQEDLVANNKEIYANIGRDNSRHHIINECINLDKRSSIHQKITTLAVSYYNLAVELEHEGLSELSLDWYERAIKVMECDPSHNISLLKSFQKSYKIAEKRLLPNSKREDYSNTCQQREHKNTATKNILPEFRQKETEDKKSHENKREPVPIKNRYRAGEFSSNVRPVSADHTVVKGYSSNKNKERNIRNDDPTVYNKSLSKENNTLESNNRIKSGDKLRPQSAYPRLLKTSHIFDKNMERDLYIRHDENNHNLNNSTSKDNDQFFLKNSKSAPQTSNSFECKEKPGFQLRKSPEDIIGVDNKSSNEKYIPSVLTSDEASNPSSFQHQFTDIFYIASRRIQAIARGYIVRSKIKQNPIQKKIDINDDGNRQSQNHTLTESYDENKEIFTQEIMNLKKDRSNSEKKSSFDETEGSKNLMIKERNLEIEGKTFIAHFYKTIGLEDSLNVILSTAKDGIIFRAVLPSIFSNQSTVEDEIQHGCKYIEDFVLKNFCKKQKDIPQNEDNYNIGNQSKSSSAIQNGKRSHQTANQGLEKLHGEAVNLAAIEIQRIYKGYRTRQKRVIRKKVIESTEEEDTCTG